MYPETERWKAVVDLFRKYAETYTSAQHLVELSLGKISECPFTSASVSELKNEVINQAQSHEMDLQRAEDDRNDVPIDWRSGDRPGAYAQGVRVGPRIRMPRLPALYRPNKQTHWSIWTSNKTSNTPGGETTLPSLHWKRRFSRYFTIKRREDKSWYCQNWKQGSSTLRLSSHRWAQTERINRTGRLQRGYCLTVHMDWK